MKYVGELIDELLKDQSQMHTVYLRDAVEKISGEKLAPFRQSLISSSSIENLCEYIRREVQGRLKEVDGRLRTQMIGEGHKLLQDIWKVVEPMGIELGSVFTPIEYINNYPAA